MGALLRCWKRKSCSWLQKASFHRNRRGCSTSHPGTLFRGEVGRHLIRHAGQIQRPFTAKFQLDELIQWVSLRGRSAEEPGFCCRAGHGGCGHHSTRIHSNLDYKTDQVSGPLLEERIKVIIFNCAFTPRLSSVFTANPSPTCGCIFLPHRKPGLWRPLARQRHCYHLGCGRV